MKNILMQFISFCNTIFPKKDNYLLFTSYPDMSDNSYAFYTFMVTNHLNDHIFIWLVEPNFSNNSIVDKHTKVISKKSILGFYYYCRSKYIFFTHGLYNGVEGSKKQIIINLWHGMPLKNIGYLDNKSQFPKANYTIATSHAFQTIMSNAFNIPKNKVLITGQPRNQYLLKLDDTVLDKFGINKNNYHKVIAWLPTYRKSNFGDVRDDGVTQALLPAANKEELLLLDKYFIEKNIFCFIKLHPMDSLSKSDFDIYTHIKVLTNDDFNKESIQLYSFLANTDALITDYSSVYIDYMLTKKPIGFIIPDIHEYSNNRGFVFDNAIDKLPGKIIQDFSQIEAFILSVAEDKEEVTYLENGLFEFYHCVEDNFSEHIYNAVFHKGK